MNKRIIEKTNMFANVDEVFKSHQQVVAAVPALLQFVTKFRSSKESIDLKIQSLTEGTKGITKNKKQCKEQLATLLSGVSGAIRAYGASISDHSLKEKARSKVSKLKNMRDKELLELSQSIYALANSLATALQDYDITANNLADLNTAVVEFKSLSPKVSSKKVGNKTIRESLWETIDEANGTLEDIDDLMLTQQQKTPEFYNVYTNARVNYSMGSRSRDTNSPMESSQDMPAATPSNQSSVVPANDSQPVAGGS